MRFLLTILFLTGLYSSMMAQSSVGAVKPAKIYKKPDSKGILYFEEESFGLKYKTNGWALFYNKTKILHATKKKFWEIEFSKTKHEKEIKTESLYTQGGPISPKNYYFGKINSLYTISYRKGYIYMLSEKTIRSGIDISLNVAYGLSLGLVKPYELILQYRNDKTDSVFFSTEKYSSTNADAFLSPSTIYGYAGFWHGLAVKPIPGASFRIGLAFDWSAFDDNISSLEIGFNADAYALNIPLMALAKNHQIFPAMYVSYRFGGRK